MSTSLAVVINVVLDAAIVVAILGVLGWGMRAQNRDMKRIVERRRRADRRRSAHPVPAHAERRRDERRGRPAVA